VRRVAGECFEDELMENKNKMYVKKIVNIYIYTGHDKTRTKDV
jgi:hypothetical protein